MQTKRWLTRLWVILAILLAGDAWEATAQVKLRGVVLPLTNYAPLTIAKEKGWFAEENLDVSWTNVAQGAIAIEAVYGGSAEFGASSIFEPLVARGNGLDIVYVVAQTRLVNQPPDNTQMLVRAEDPIRSPKDLAGKTMSAGLINSVNYIHTHVWLRKHGVDPKTVRFLEVPFPQMNDALFQKRIDAAFNVEPFATFALKTGKARSLGHPYLENIPGMDIAHYIAKESWVKANADTMRRFKKAVDRATNHLNSVPKDERTAWIAKYTGMKPEIVAAVNLPVFTTEYNVESLRKNLELAVEFKLIKQPFDVTTMIWKP
jgi:NitT/TauT family transport system substrate-binding protein